MKIKKVEITNYKAFLGTHTFNFSGKNVFIYGENGSGKSSLYYALKDFFQSSIEEIDLTQLSNIFIKESDKGKEKIQVSLMPENTRPSDIITYDISTAGKNHGGDADTLVRDTSKLKSFLTYKHLLDIHHLKKGDDINLFNLLVNGVLRHLKYSLTGPKELGELWQEVNEAIEKPTSRQYYKRSKVKVVNEAIKLFNVAFGELFKRDSPEYIINYTKPILDRFGHQIDVELTFPQIRPSTDYTSIEESRVDISITYAGKKIQAPHLFLNEARLSAIAISIYLGMVKRHPQGLQYKLLFLDDIFIGLDISNRLPLLDILEQDFSDYQVFITTYDKPWFEYAKSFLDGKNNWKTIELYAQKINENYEIPYILDQTDLLSKAKQHLQNSDYKAAAVYTRSAFEKILRCHCDKRRKAVTFHLKQKNYSSNDFWSAITADLDSDIVNNVERFRELVLNAFSHYNTEKHEIRSELESAIEVIENLRENLNYTD